METSNEDRYTKIIAEHGKKLKVLAIDSKYDSIRKENDKESLLKSLTEDCISLFMDKTEPQTMMLNMQNYFDLNFQNNGQFLTEHRAECKKKSEPFLKRILLTGDGYRFHEILLNEIAAYILIQEERSNKFDARMISEIKSCILSVLPVSEIPQFLEFHQKERKTYLFALAPVCAGIRLYSCWNTESGQQAIKKVISSIAKAPPKLVLELRVQFLKAQESIKHLQVILKCFLLDENPKSEIKPMLIRLKSILAFLHQYIIYLSVMMAEADTLALRTFQLRQSFMKAINDLKSLLNIEATIPPNIFSYYKEVSIAWKHMKEELLYTIALVNNLRKLKNFATDIRSFIDNKEVTVLLETSSNRKNDTESQDDLSPKLRKSFSTSSVNDNSSFSGKRNELCILYPESVQNFEDISLKYGGFCPWAFVQGEGLLLPGIRKFGIVMYKNQCYSFSCIEGRNAFLEDPEFYISSVWNIVRTQGHLVLILRLHSEFGIAYFCEDTTADKSIAPIFIDSQECQTLLHPIEQHLDYKYKWNQWQYRKEALKYLDLKSKNTRSTQTHLSHFRRENFSQVYLPKPNWSQTKRDGSTFMPRKGIPELIPIIRTSILLKEDKNI